jgi:two-component system, OmpR family, alkaline phosphatase synthesis response regulator PhoP
MPKIAIVEDDDLISQLYQTAFTFDGYEVVMAPDGEQGLEKIRHEHPDLVLLDIMMPHMNGLEVLDRLKADPDTKKIPVIMLTNLDRPQDSETALAKGAVKYIVKAHYNPKQITEMVKEILHAYTP